MLSFGFLITRRRNCAENRMQNSGPLVLEGNYLAIDAFQIAVPIQNGKRAGGEMDRANGLAIENTRDLALENARVACYLSIESRVRFEDSRIDLILIFLPKLVHRYTVLKDRDPLLDQFLGLLVRDQRAAVYRAQKTICPHHAPPHHVRRSDRQKTTNGSTRLPGNHSLSNSAVTENAPRRDRLGHPPEFVDNVRALHVRPRVSCGRNWIARWAEPAVGERLPGRRESRWE